MVSAFVLVAGLTVALWGFLYTVGTVVGFIRGVKQANRELEAERAAKARANHSH